MKLHRKGMFIELWQKTSILEKGRILDLPKPASSWKTQNERIKTRVDGDLGKITRFLLGPWYLTYVS